MPKKQALKIPCVYTNRQTIDTVIQIIADWSKKWTGHRKYGWFLSSKSQATFFFYTEEEVTPLEISELYARLMDVPGLAFINTQFN